MFVSLGTKQQTSSSEGPNDKLTLQRSKTPATPQFQSMETRIPSHELIASAITSEKERGTPQSERAPAGLPSKFSSIPVFAPDRRNTSQPLSAIISLPGIPFLQRKVKIGAVNDLFEQEADRVADHVMRAPASPSTGSLHSVSPGIVQRACAHCEEEKKEEETLQRKPADTNLHDFSSLPPQIHSVHDGALVQRDIGADEIQEQLIHAYMSEPDTLQRQPDGSAENHAEQTDEELAAAGEQILMQAKAAGPLPISPQSYLESGVHSLEGGGHPLPSTVRQYMEPRFGHDFGNVRVHTDSNAAEMAKLANARAFTIGRNVVFASGEYAPDTSEGSRRLLAHELTHVIQQGRSGPRIQRKIVVGGNPYTPTAKYLKYLDTTFGSAMKEFVERMHNGGNPPVFAFSSYEQMGNEVRVRAKAIKGIEEVHKGCCGYYSTTDPPYLDSTYWDQIGTGAAFKLKSPLPAGKHSSDAIEAIFAPGANTKLECFGMTLAIEYYSLLKGLGAAQFDLKFPAGIEISPANAILHPLLQTADKKYKVISVASKNELLPGDWVYFKNFHDYTTKHPGGFWQGENAIYLGGGQYRGFGVVAQTEDNLNQELVNQYNLGASPPLKTVAELIADGGGLLLNPVIRPDIATVAP